MNVRTILCLLLAARGFAAAAAPATALVLPFENLSSSETAGAEIQRRLVAALEQKGWTIVANARVEAALAERRIRYVDALDDAMRTAMFEELGAIAYVSGSVYTFEGGRNPVVSFCARMIRADGTIAWGDVIGLAAADTERLLGFGRAKTVEEVADAAIMRLAKRLPHPSDEPSLQYGPARRLFLSRPAAWRA